ncbi:MAG: hypothetical protein AAF590_08865 [Pseudomonadota bacterium]
MDALRILYLDDCAIDHKLMRAYLELDEAHSYRLTACSTLDEAERELQRASFDVLILDNRIPPDINYHRMYKSLKERAGFIGPAVVVSADVEGAEFNETARQDHEAVIDKADLLGCIRDGQFAAIIADQQASITASVTG